MTNCSHERREVSVVSAPLGAAMPERRIQTVVSTVTCQWILFVYPGVGASAAFPASSPCLVRLIRKTGHKDRVPLGVIIR